MPKFFVVCKASRGRLASSPRWRWRAGNEILFETETTIEGEIAPAAAGAHGFGYDPIFRYPPLNVTTAELTDDEKAAVSHRARAFRDLRRWLLSQSEPASLSRKFTQTVIT